MKQSNRNTYSSVSQRFHTHQLAADTVVKQPYINYHKRGLSSSQHQFPRTRREQSTHCRPQYSNGDFYRHYDNNNDSNGKRRNRRTRIFQPSPMQIEHLQLGAELSNLNFEELDRSLLPRMFYSSRCGCENSLQPCVRVVRSLNQLALQQMRVEYQRLKERDTHNVSYMIIRDLMRIAPTDFPSAFCSVIENLLQLIEVGEAQLLMLCSVVWHCKSEFLTYFVFSEMARLVYDNQTIHSQVEHYITKYSKDLHILLEESSRVSLERLYAQFIESGGTSLIPIAEYGKYIENLNRVGRCYPGRVLFAALLSCKRQIQSAGLTIGDILERNFSALVREVPWGLVFEAAQHPYLR